MFLDSVIVSIQWKDFEVAFYEKYFPNHVRDRFDRDFWDLEQGSMIVGEYEATCLEQFTQTFDSDEQRAKRFLEGLQPGLRLKVMACRC